MGFPLTKAHDWLAKREKDIQKPEQTFIAASHTAAQRRRLRSLAPVAVLAVVLAAGAAAWWRQDWLKEETYALLNATPRTMAEERALKAGDPFKECRDCPDMIVVPVGRFTMGSPEGKGQDSERPQHDVTFAKPFAVAKVELTFDEWGACVDHGDCAQVSDSGWGRGRQPAINVSWDDAQVYVKWLSRITGKEYRLLSEAEYEYAARAGTETNYPWGDEIKFNGKPMANCYDCGSQWDDKQTAPVGSFDANGFGLQDMVGNVWEWTQDCYRDNYSGAPGSDSEWIECADRRKRVVRGGSWWKNREAPPSQAPRSANRTFFLTDYRDAVLGFRVARTLTP